MSNPPSPSVDHRWLPWLRGVCLAVVLPASTGWSAPHPLPLVTPLHFEENRGQGPRDARFLARGAGFALALGATAIEVGVHRREAGNGASGTTLTLHLVGAAPAPAVTADTPLPGRVHHFLGHDPTRWIVDIPTFGAVRYREVYPGIDLVHHGREGELEYDFVVAPGARPELIRMSFSGVKELELEATGDLLLHLEGGCFRHRRPVIYQEDGPNRTPVDGRFARFPDGTVGFEIGAYDRSRPLVIDPILVYSTYLGSGAAESVTDLEVDAAGYVYVTGSTASLGDFPFTNAAQTHEDPRIGSTGQANAFVARFQPNGQLEYATYLGGEERDYGLALTTDLGGNAYVTGQTFSSPRATGPFPDFTRDGFPTTPGVLQTNFVGSGRSAVPFLTKLGSSGQIRFSTFLLTQGGGTDLAEGVGVSVDLAGRPAVLVQEFGGQGGYLLQLDPEARTALLTNRLNYNVLTDLAQDRDGAFHLVGRASGSVALTNSFTPQGGCSTCAFYQKRSPTGNLLYSAIFPDRSTANAIAVDGEGNAYITGQTDATLTSAEPPYVHWPVRNAPQPTNGGGLQEAFVLKIDPRKSGPDSLLYSTFLGGDGDDRGHGIDVDELGRAYVTGSTTSANFPLASALQTNLAGGSDVFITELNEAGTGWIFSTFLGGAGNDAGEAIAVRIGATDVYVAGGTESADFPVRSALQSGRFGVSDGFMARVQLTEPVATFTVNSENDLDDGDCDTAHCSLREAILAANRTPGRQTIRFEDPVLRITPRTPLPAITDPVVIEDLPDFAGIGLLFLEINGELAGEGAHGLVIRSGASELRGLRLSGFRGYGAVLENGGTNLVDLCSFEPGIITEPGNLRGGLLIRRSHGNQIGSSEWGCTFSGNGGQGIHLREGSTGNRILGCTIGFPVGNGGSGILIEDSPGTQIGDATPVPGSSPGNRIMGSAESGILVTGAGSQGTVIRGNVIGSDDAEGGNRVGITLESADNLVGGTNAVARNLISGNAEAGVVLQGGNSTGNVIAGNWIGLNSTGDNTHRNHGEGVLIRAPASGNQIGGPTRLPGQPPGNVISGNAKGGVVIQGAARNTIAGNLIGTSALRERVLASNGSGVEITEGTDNLVGGFTAEERNVISGNLAQGIVSKRGVRNRILGNWVGLHPDGRSSLPNGADQIWLLEGEEEAVGDSTSQPGIPPGNVIASFLEKHPISGSPPSVLVLETRNFLVRGNLVGTDAEGSSGLSPACVGLEVLNTTGGEISQNVLSANQIGIRVQGTAFPGPPLRILGNLIGTDVSGLFPLPNVEEGIWVAGLDPSSVEVGGLAAGDGNRIAFNRGSGIRLDSRWGTARERISRNSIGANGDSGIRRTGPGPRIRLRSVHRTAAGLYVKGEIQGQTNDHPRLEFFTSSACDASGFGEGETWLEAMELKLDHDGGRFAVHLPQTLPLGTPVTATATFARGSTTEFSECVFVKEGEDLDGDGLPDLFEEEAPNLGDGNLDGIPDVLQPHVASAIYWWDGEALQTLTLERPPGPARTVFTVDSPGQESVARFAAPDRVAPHGFFLIHYEISAPAPQRAGVSAPLASAVEFSLFPPTNSPANRLFVVGPEGPSPASDWFDFAWDGTTGARFENGRVRITFIDGSRGDADGLVNGLIVCRGALAYQGTIPLQLRPVDLLAFDRVLLTLQAPAGTPVLLERSASLQSWTPFRTQVVATGYYQTVDSTADGADAQFYRARVVP